MPNYQPMNLSVQEIVDLIDEGRIQLPEFQRGFDWNSTNRRELIESVQRGYPAGTLLLLAVDPESGVPFGTRCIQHAPLHESSRARYLVLDGQQRLTSLYLAVRAKTEWLTALRLRDFYQSWRASDGRAFSELLTGPKRPANPMVLLLSRDLLPLEFLALKDPEEKRNASALLRAKLTEYRNGLTDESDRNYSTFIDTELAGLLDEFQRYTFPCVVLNPALHLEAICNVFTKINTTGKKLSAFDLCVATLYPQGIRLRALLNEARSKEGFSVVDVDGTNALQAVALLANASPKKNSLPAVVKKPMLDAHWPSAIGGLARAASLLQQAGAWDHGSLPYDAMVPSLAAALATQDPAKLSIPQQNALRQRVEKWVLHSAFSGRYSEGTDVKQVTDYKDVPGYLMGGPPPTYLEDPVVWPPTTVDVRSGARSKAFLMRLNAGRPKDFMTDVQVGKGEGRTASDLHHIFPKQYLKESGYQPREINRTMNMTFLSLETNRSLSDKSPRDYLTVLIAHEAKNKNISEKDATALLKARLATHLIDDEQWDAMMKNDYDQFLQARAAAFQRSLKGAGLEFAAGSTVDDNPDEEETSEEDDQIG